MVLGVFLSLAATFGAMFAVSPAAEKAMVLIAYFAVVCFAFAFDDCSRVNAQCGGILKFIFKLEGAIILAISMDASVGLKGPFDVNVAVGAMYMEELQLMGALAGEEMDASQ